jgi:hypothetical protein
MHKRALYTAIAILLPLHAWAAGWGGSLVQVKEISTGEQKLILFTGNPNVPGYVCSKAQTDYWILSGNSQNRDRLVELATAAYLASRRVKVYWNGACDAQGYALMSGLEVQW